MIVDKLENVILYSQIPDYVKDFVLKLNCDCKSGRYNLLDSDYANIETYNTKLREVAKYETHDKYIDIQILLKGSERIYIKSRNNLTKLDEYNEEKDITFYSDSVDSDFVTLDSSNFVMIYPHEAHAPQVAVNESIEVKKVVVKIKV